MYIVFWFALFETLTFLRCTFFVSAATVTHKDEHTEENNPNDTVRDLGGKRWNNI